MTEKLKHCWRDGNFVVTYLLITADSRSRPGQKNIRHLAMTFLLQKHRLVFGDSK